MASHGDLLTYEEIVTAVKIFARRGITKVRITGGEPLVRRGVLGLIRKLAQVEGIEDLSLTTNGVLLKDFARGLVAAGLRRINVSLDTLIPERFAYITRRDRFQQVWEGIEEAIAAGLSPVKINVVVIKGFNADEVEAFARLSLFYPLHVRFIEFMPIGVDGEWGETEILPSAQLMERIRMIGEIVPLEPSRNGGPAKRFRIDGGIGEIGFITPISSHFCDQCNRLRLTPDGKIRPCLFSDAEFDLKGPLREGKVGQIEQVLAQALAAKPPGHRIGDRRIKKCQRGMYAIGG